MTRRCWILIAFLTLSINVAPAQVIEGTPQQDWGVVSIVDEETGVFSYCSVENSFDNGLSFAIARDPSGRTNLAVGFPQARLDTGAQFPLEVRLDDGQMREISGFAAEPGVLVVPIGNDPAFTAALAGARRVFIRGPNDSVAFRLQGGTAAMAALDACLREGGGGNDARASVPQTPRPAVPPAQASLALEAVLEEAGLAPDTLIRIPDDDGVDPYRMDFGWRFESFYGGAAELPQAADFAELLGGFIDRFQDRCPSGFVRALAPLQRVGGLRTGRAQLECRDLVPASFAALFAYSDGRMMTIILHEGADAQARNIEAATDAIASVIETVAMDRAR